MHFPGTRASDRRGSRSRDPTPGPAQHQPSSTPRHRGRHGPTAQQEATPVKFRVERDVLADAVAWTARALPLRPSAPVLAGLLIEAGAIDGTDGLQLSTFDYETSARATLNADVAS